MDPQEEKHLVVPTDDLPPYTYEQLKAPKSIRLLRILPALDDSAGIEIILEEFDKSTPSCIPFCPQYIALSYIWGDPHICLPVTVSGKVFQVTLNLHEALVYLRSAFPNNVFWIDALSINQDDPRERGHQVALMRSIYSGASEVITWLGRDEANVDTLFQFVKSHHSSCAFLHDPVEGCGQELSAGSADAVQHLISQPYWNRVWIIQEIVVAKVSVIMCGSQFIQWPIFTHFLRLISWNHFRMPEHVQSQMSQNYPRIQSILRLGSWSATSVDLAQALYWSMLHLATDDRDKVYAVLGLVNSGAGQVVSLSYQYPTCTVFHLAIGAMLEDWNDHSRMDERRLDYYTKLMASEVRSLPAHCVSAARGYKVLEEAVSRNHSREQNFDLARACDGTACGTKDAMLRIARWHTFPAMSPRGSPTGPAPDLQSRWMRTRQLTSVPSNSSASSFAPRLRMSMFGVETPDNKVESDPPRCCGLPLHRLFGRRK